MPDRIREDMPWDKIAEDAYKAFMLRHDPRRTPDGFSLLTPLIQECWIAAMKQAVKSYMENDIPEWQKTPRVEPVKPKPEEYDPDTAIGNG